MKSAYFLLAFMLKNIILVNCLDPEKELIAGGDNVTIEEVPYQASLMLLDKYNVCGATIIHNYWVLTAAHCYFGMFGLNFTVRTGTNERDGTGNKFEIDKVIIHHKYYFQWLDNDIALIKLKDPIEFNEKQNSIPLANSTDIPEEGQYMLISGFGLQGTKIEPSPLLKKTYVPVTNQSACKESYDTIETITDQMFCAGDGYNDACKGDSGGPGVINGKVYGVVSNGRDCPSQTLPGIYTRVHVYYNWVWQVTGLWL